MNISGLVITYNEENHIANCIDSMLRVCDEVIVIDSNSVDNTVEIAKSKGAKVYMQDFLGDGPQRTFGLQFCKNDWILNLDADESLEEDAYAFIKEGSFFKASPDGYAFRRNNYLGNELVNFSGWYPDRACRFFNKQTAKPENTRVHQKIVGKNIVVTKLHLKHYAWKDLFHIIEKKNQYTTWQAEEMFESGKRAFVFDPPIHGVISLFRCYFLKKGFLHGLDGFTFALIQAFFSYQKYAKLIKLYKMKGEA